MGSEGPDQRARSVRGKLNRGLFRGSHRTHSGSAPAAGARFPSATACCLAPLNACTSPGPLPPPLTWLTMFTQAFPRQYATIILENRSDHVSLPVEAGLWFNRLYSGSKKNFV